MTIAFEAARGACVLIAIILAMRWMQWCFGVARLWICDRPAAYAEIYTIETFRRISVRAGTLLLIILAVSAFLLPMLSGRVNWMQPVAANAGGALIAVHCLLVMLAYRWMHYAVRKRQSAIALAGIIWLSWWAALAERVAL